jgi:aspartyl-tRNA(Asn)/glutamyl-tRNA(Gln) amidotransferase subunit C
MIDAERVRHVARLARLELTEEEVRRAGEELGKILAYVEQIGRMDLAGVEPLAHAGDFDTPLRPDAPAAPLSPEAARANAPAADEAGFIVPPVLEGP